MLPGKANSNRFRAKHFFMFFAHHAAARTGKSAMCASQGVNLMFAKFLKDESGASAIEYGLIAGLISVAAIAAVTAMGGSLSKIYNTAKTALSGAAG
ncbi:MAG: Flp family type IVb pilin [Rhodospirillales bacterium]